MTARIFLLKLGCGGPGQPTRKMYEESIAPMGRLYIVRIA
jgi:hypothetical protein